ncbi:MAG: hypothetical protein QOJ35_2715, partial [Solirubrobacteraceae bacterium]|nr:hypothetical protein [Solirubrobacteraceae bacterium]
HDELLARSALYRDLVGRWGARPAHAVASVNGTHAARRGVLARVGRMLVRRGR